MRKVLAVEDDHSLCDLISIAIRREGLDAGCSDDADDASAPFVRIEAARTARPH